MRPANRHVGGAWATALARTGPLPSHPPQPGRKAATSCAERQREGHDMTQAKVRSRPGKAIVRIAQPPEEWEELGPGVERFRRPDEEPVRRIITRGGVRRVGGYYSWKMRHHIVWESGPEERCAMLMDVHPSIAAFHAQPETIRVEVPGEKSFRYTPDFVCAIAGQAVRIEVKRLQDLFPKEPAGPHDEFGLRRWLKARSVRARLRSVQAAYARCGLAWLLLTDVRMVAMAAPEVVDELVAHGGRHITEGDRRRLHDHLVAESSSSLGAAADVLREADDPCGTVLARVSEGALAVDLRGSLDADARVRLVR